MQWPAVGNCRGCKLDKQHSNMFNICHSNWCLQSTEGVKKSDSDTIKTSTGPLQWRVLPLFSAWNYYLLSRLCKISRVRLLLLLLLRKACAAYSSLTLREMDDSHQCPRIGNIVNTLSEDRNIVDWGYSMSQWFFLFEQPLNCHC